MEVILLQETADVAVERSRGMSPPVMLLGRRRRKLRTPLGRLHLYCDSPRPPKHLLSAAGGALKATGAPSAPGLQPTLRELDAQPQERAKTAPQS